jgi:SAM-dependent methyltransferase
MDLFEQTLGDIQGGWVLDVATGRGGFVELLADRLGGYRQIVGVDIAAPMIAGASRDTGQERTHFIQMDAGRLGFADESFDMVSISASLHHLADASPVLSEIGRMLRPGGHLVVAEMHRDATTEAQRTSVRLHNWAAAVDSALGLPHYPTLTRQQILDLVEALDLCNVSVYDWADVDSDPLAEGRIRALEGVFERYLSRAQELPDHPAVEAQAQALRRRLGEVGAQSEPRIAIVGRKPSRPILLPLLL